MYRILSTNVDTLKERKLEAKTAEISVAVLDEDVRKGIEDPIFYAFRNGRIYNPHNNFFPNIENAHRIKGILVDEYWSQVDRARANYKELLKRETEPKKNTGEKEKDDRGMQALAQKEKELEAQSKLIAEQAKIIEEMKKNVKQGETRHPEFDKLVKIINYDLPVFLYGPAGTGKSVLAEQVAKELELDFFPASTITQEFKLTGFIDAGGKYHATNFYKAIKNGGLFFLDEIDASSPDVLIMINGALANGYFDFPHETVKKHKDFRVMCAGNTIGRGANEEYTGRQALDVSTLDRFMAIKIDYSIEIDRAVAKGDQELVEFAHSLRHASETSAIPILVSYRSIDRIAKFKDEYELGELLHMALIKGLEPEDMRMLSRNMTITSSNQYYKAFKNAI